MYSWLLYRRFFHQVPDFFAVIDRDFRIEMCNWRGGYDFVPEKLRRRGALCYELFYPGQDRPCLNCPVAEVFHTGEPVVREKYDPRIGHMEARCFPVFNRLGEVVLVAEQLCNISARKDEEAGLREQIGFLQTLMDAIPVPVFYKNERGVFQGCNLAFAEYFGKSRQEIIGRTVFDIAPKELAGVYREADQELLQQGGIQVFESGVVHADGTLHAVVFTNATFARPDGAPAGLVGTILDITERALSVEQLRESEERFRQLFEEALTGNFVAAVNGRLVACNQAFARIFGFASVEEALRFNSRGLYVRPDEREAILERLRREKRIEHHELEMRSPAGQRLHLVLNAVGIFDEGGELVELRGHIRDDTERKSLQEQLGHAQKMEAVGRLAGGLAHDFNNLLTVVIGYCEILQQRLEDPELVDCVKQIKEAGDRASGLTRQLLAFSRRQVLHTEEIDLRGVLKGLEGLLHGLLTGGKVEISILPGKGPGRIRADRIQIEQVIMNLAVNARDAMPEGGRLTLSLDNVHLKESDSLSSGHCAVKAGYFVRFTVGDTGQGIEPVVLPHIFEPFFTTKEKGKGTGLGLASVYGIVTQSGGFIDVESSPGRGTTFKIYLPRVGVGTNGKNEGSEET
jgi:PAS domain S-box-containing protein